MMPKCNKSPEINFLEHWHVIHQNIWYSKRYGSVHVYLNGKYKW